MQRKNVLVLSAGRRVSLVRGFMDAVAQYNGCVYAADLKPELSSACQVADKNIVLPHCLAPEFIPQLMHVCAEKNIGLVVPTIDTELQVLSTSRSEFENVGTSVIVSDDEVIKLCRDKRKTAAFFERIGLETPELFDKNSIEFPVLVKPYDGSLSSGVVYVNDRNSLTSEILENEKNIYCQYIDPEHHDEFTVDMYFDRDAVLRCVVPRQRLEVRGGEVAKAMAVKNGLVEKLFDCFANIGGFRGCVNIQLFLQKQSSNCWAIEINPRFGGGYPLTRLTGANFEKWLLDEYLGGKRVDSFHDWQDRLIMLRYDDEVLVDGRDVFHF